MHLQILFVNLPNFYVNNSNILHVSLMLITDIWYFHLVEVIGFFLSRQSSTLCVIILQMKQIGG